jgi:hypothetical protein
MRTLLHFRHFFIGVVAIAAALQWSVVVERTWAAIWACYKFAGYGGGGHIVVGRRLQALFLLGSCVLASIGCALSRAEGKAVGAGVWERLARLAWSSIAVYSLFWFVLLLTLANGRMGAHMIRFVKYSSVSCLMVGIALTFLQPAISHPQEPATEKRAETRFIGPNGIFRFKYDNSLVKCTRDSRQSDLWIPVKSCAGYIPVCADFSGTGDDTIACVAYPALAMKGTNFEAAAFSVNLVNATTTDVCLNVAEPNVRTLRKEKVNGMTFTLIEAGGVAAGNLMDGEAYRTFHQNKCYELDIRIASSNIGNYDPGTVRGFGREAVYSRLKSVLNTFQFGKYN